MERNEFCPLCDHFMEGQLVDFPCGHSAHSSCFFRLLNNETYSLSEQDRKCQFCEAPLFVEDPDDLAEEALLDVQETNEVIEDIPGNTTHHQRLRKRFFANDEFQKDIKAYLKLKRACGPKKQSLKKFTSGKKKEIQHSVRSLRQQLRDLLKAQKRIILQSNPYKEYKALHFRIILSRSAIIKRYNVDLASLRNALRNDNGYRLWSREYLWRDAPSYILRRAFYRQSIRY